jgi:uncharacterized membrane protein YagU involved in acid resistance
MSHQATSVRSGLIQAILIAGLIAGTLDILAAITQTLLNDRSPITMLKFIASGIFGPEVLKGGSQYAMYGLLFHYIIATGWSVLLFLIYTKVKFFSRNWIITGLIYGLFVWLVMNRVVLPLSNTPPLPFTFGWSMVISCLVIMGAVGLPLSYRVGRYYGKRV